MCLACVFVWVTHVDSDYGGQKKALDSLEIELARVVNFHVGAGKQTLSAH